VSVRDGNFISNRDINAWNSLPDVVVLSCSVASNKRTLQSLDFHLIETMCKWFMCKCMLNFFTYVYCSLLLGHLLEHGYLSSVLFGVFVLLLCQRINLIDWIDWLIDLLHVCACTLQYRIDFSNAVAIVAKTSDTADIMFDGQPVTTQTSWSAASNWGYSYAAFPVSHGMHAITLTQGSSAKFGAYLYGHSLIDTSSSAYGFTVGYKRKDFIMVSACGRMYCIISYIIRSLCSEKNTHLCFLA